MKKIIITGICVLFVWLLFGFIAYIQPWVKPGEFGDMFGAANALFSGFALVGAIFAIYHQQEEIRMVKKDIEEKDKKHRKAIEPKLNFTQTTSDGLLEIHVHDKNDMLRNPKVHFIRGKLDGLNIASQGTNQYRIAARVDDSTESLFEFTYEDIEGNTCKKFISWNPYQEKDTLD